MKICKPEFPIWKIFTNWLYETTLMRFVFTWLPCWSKKHHYSGVYRGSKFMHFDKSCAKMSQNHTSNLDKVFLNVPPSSDFGLEARILQIGWFYRPNWKKVEKSASKNKHPIKLRFFIWRLQSANPKNIIIQVKISQNHTSNLDKVFLKLPPSSDFGLEARILQIGWNYGPKWNKVEKSA